MGSKDKTSTTTKSFKVPKTLIYYLKALRFFSKEAFKKNLLTIFFRPIPFPIPKREIPFSHSAKSEKFKINKEGNEAMVHIYGDETKPKVLLIHGWSGRGTQFYEMAPALAKNEFCTISITGPAHGELKGNYTHMLQFAEAILAAEKNYGPFTYAIGHSLGGLAIMNAIRCGFDPKKIVVMGTPSKLSSVVADFCRNLEMGPAEEEILTTTLKDKFDEFENFSAHHIAKSLTTPGFIVHDKNDIDVNVEEAYSTHSVWKNSELYLTEKLGHRRILSDQNVIEKVLNFLKSTTN